MGIIVRVTISDDGRARSVTQFTTENSALLETTTIRLTDGDAAYARDGLARIPLRETWNSFLNIYQYEVGLDAVEGDRLSFALERSDDASASDTSVVIPQSFEAEAPEQFSMTPGPFVIWDGAEDADALTINFDRCFRPIDVDPSIKTLTTDQLVWDQVASTGEPCEFNMTIHATRFGEVDPAFGRGGQISATQKRSLKSIAIP